MADKKELLRTFLAVFPPAVIQRAAARVSDRLRRADDGVSWVKPDNLHYTLRFLGDLGEDGARRAAEAAIEAASRHHPFTARLGSLGAFPKAHRARVIWLGLAEGSEALEALATSVEEALRRKGFDRADRPFAAHLTLGRVRDPRHDWTAALAAAAGTVTGAREAMTFRIEAVRVVASQLSPQGSIYTVRAEAPLAD